MLNKLLNDFQEKMIAEDFSDNTTKNYISDVGVLTANLRKFRLLMYNKNFR